MTELIDGYYTEGEKIADTRAPMDVPIAERWSTRKFRGGLVNPTNRRKLHIIVVGTGLAGGAAAAHRRRQLIAEEPSHPIRRRFRTLSDRAVTPNTWARWHG